METTFEHITTNCKTVADLIKLDKEIRNGNTN